MAKLDYDKDEIQLDIDSRPLIDIGNNGSLYAESKTVANVLYVRTGIDRDFSAFCMIRDPFIIDNAFMVVEDADPKSVLTLQLNLWDLNDDTKKATVTRLTSSASNVAGNAYTLSATTVADAIKGFDLVKYYPHGFGCQIKYSMPTKAASGDDIQFKAIIGFRGTSLRRSLHRVNR